MSAPRVRRLGAGDDLSRAAGLLVRFFAEEGFDTPEPVIRANAARLAAIGACGLFVAESGGAGIGVATVSMEFGIEYGWWGEMGDLYVVPEWRGRGVSRALIGAVESFLRERGAGGYQVTVAPFAEERHGLSRFYASAGFESQGRLILRRML